MTSPTFNKAVFGAWGLLIATVAPYAAYTLTVIKTGNILAGVAVAGLLVYVMMTVSISLLSLAQYLPENMPLGPSGMLGTGIITIGMLGMPTFVVPGLVWLFLLPFDEHGSLSWSAALSFDFEEVEPPHHA